MRCKDAKWAIYGNSEHKNGVQANLFSQLLSQNGITPLVNSCRVLQRGTDSLCIAGVDDPCTGYDDLDGALEQAPRDTCTVLLMHSPDPVGAACARGMDLVISGHTHGGQVRLPFVGAVLTRSELGRRMCEGLYAGKRLQSIIGQRPGRTQLYISRGVGVSGLAIRFLCPPQINLITLRRP
jgi:predicted MPP superfamily phosphohydrolase